MSDRLLTVSRSARLVGVSRHNLQKKIQNGEITTFEGKIAVKELLRIYPHVQVEDNTMIAKIERVKAEVKRSQSENLINQGSPEILAARLATLRKELMTTKIELRKYTELTQRIAEKITDSENDSDELGIHLRHILEQFLSDN